jgi:hypothetical protein
VIHVVCQIQFPAILIHLMLLWLISPVMSCPLPAMGIVKVPFLSWGFCQVDSATLSGRIIVHSWNVTCSAFHYFSHVAIFQH